MNILQVEDFLLGELLEVFSLDSEEQGTGYFPIELVCGIGYRVPNPFLKGEEKAWIESQNRYG
ncbi:MAG: hypothetical protein QHH21_00175 [Caldisericota bacterium]|nr:hypothetical protein [Caldisericota bacterium]